MNAPTLSNEQATELLGEPLISAEQAARFLGVSKRYVWRLAREGKLPAHKVGKYTRFRPDAVAAFLEERRVGPRARRAHVEAPRERLGSRPRETTTRRRF